MNPVTFEADDMDRTARARMQARVVLVVYRAEMRRMSLLDMPPTDRRAWEAALQRRSVQLLDDALTGLGHYVDSDRDARRHLADARAQIPDPDSG